MEITTDRQDNPVPGSGDAEAIRSQDLNCAGFVQAQAAIPQPGPEIAPVARVMCGGHAQGGPVIKSLVKLNYGGHEREGRVTR